MAGLRNVIDEEIHGYDPVEVRANIAKVRTALGRETDPLRQRILTEELNDLTAALQPGAAQAPTAVASDDWVSLPRRSPRSPAAEAAADWVSIPRRPSVSATPESPQADPRNPAFEETPGGAATGILPGLNRQPAERNPTDPSALRPFVETGGAVLGGVGGAAAGGMIGAITRNPAAPVAGMRIGEGLGAAAGSLLSEAFDPTEEPGVTALTSGGVTLLTGAAGTAGAATLRSALGNPTKAGRQLVQTMEKIGKVPPPGAIFDSQLAQSMQQVGSADAFFGKRVRDAVEATEGKVTADLAQYINHFQRHKGAADAAFKQFDDALKTKLGSNRFVTIPGEAFETVIAARNFWRQQGVEHRMPAGVQNAIGVWEQLQAAGMQNVKVKLSYEEAEAVRQLIWNQTREQAGTGAIAARSASGGDTVKALRAVARGVEDSIDRAIALETRAGRVDTQALAHLVAGREAWKTWRQGEVIEEALAKAMTKTDVTGAPIKSNDIITAVKNIQQQAREQGHRMIAPEHYRFLRDIAGQLKAVERSGSGGAWTLAVRGGQMVSLSLGVGMLGGGVGAGAAALPVILTPAMLAWMSTNKTASNLMMRGLRLQPGTALAARTTREFVTLLGKERFLPPDRVEELGGEVEE